MSNRLRRCASRFVIPAFGRARLGAALLAGLMLATSVSGCACRPGFVGRYGGLHPPRCYAY